jgi:mRNA deadenylase 3'-5' endonuclease subunit Ccr4
MADSPAMHFTVKGLLKVIGITAFYAENARNLLSLTQLEDAGFKVSANKVDNITKGFIVKNHDMAIYFTRRRGVFPLLQLTQYKHSKQHTEIANIATRKNSYVTNSINKIKNASHNKISVIDPIDQPIQIPNIQETPKEITNTPVEISQVSKEIIENEIILENSEVQSDILNKSNLH